MTEILAQGDLLFERVEDVPLSGVTIGPTAAGETILAEGEASGHRHAIFERVTLFRDDGLARDVPDGLYIGHVRVAAPGAVVHHDEHSAVPLGEGTWRIRRQRELEIRDVRAVQD